MRIYYELQSLKKKEKKILTEKEKKERKNITRRKYRKKHRDEINAKRRKYIRDKKTLVCNKNIHNNLYNSQDFIVYF